MIEIKKGTKVHYDPGYGAPENGKVKRVAEDGKHAFVVYNCAGNWEDYENYTAARTKISDLQQGWSDEAKTKFSQKQEEE